MRDTVCLPQIVLGAEGVKQLVADIAAGEVVCESVTLLDKPKGALLQQQFTLADVEGAEPVDLEETEGVQAFRGSAEEFNALMVELCEAWCNVTLTDLVTSKSGKVTAAYALTICAEAYLPEGCTCSGDDKDPCPECIEVAKAEATGAKTDDGEAKCTCTADLTCETCRNLITSTGDGAATEEPEITDESEQPAAEDEDDATAETDEEPGSGAAAQDAGDPAAQPEDDTLAETGHQ